MATIRAVKDAAYTSLMNRPGEWELYDFRGTSYLWHKKSRLSVLANGSLYHGWSGVWGWDKLLLDSNASLRVAFYAHPGVYARTADAATVEEKKLAGIIADLA
jgi:hypothetical protein